MDLKISDLNKQGVKVSYSKVRKAILSCELDKKTEDCKKMLRDLNIEVYE